MSETRQLSDMYDGDKSRRDAVVTQLRHDLSIPHPLRGVKYGDGVATFIYCKECNLQQPMVDQFETDNGDVDPRTFRVTILDCGHSIEVLVRS